MSVTSRSPVRLAGANIHSGNVSTGELPLTRGGQQSFTVFSGGLLTLGSGNKAPVTGGSTGHAVFWSGAGRLNTILPHQAISGTAGFFYDSALIARSGVATIPESGYAIVGVLPPNTIGQGTLLGAGPFAIEMDCPFQSGLALSLPSGCAGVTFTLTPEVNLPNPG